MGRIPNIIITTAFLLAAFFVACEQNEQARTPELLPKGAELAEELGGFYFREGSVAATRDMDNGMERLKLVLTNGGIKPHTVSVFLEKPDWDAVKIQSGKYEVLYLKHILILNEPQTGQRYAFTVPSDEMTQLKKRLPENILSKNTTEAIGIAFKGPLPAMKGNPEFLKDGCSASGGPGTVSCSNACCSISCKTGFYATCGQSCNCTREN